MHLSETPDQVFILTDAQKASPVLAYLLSKVTEGVMAPEQYYAALPASVAKQKHGYIASCPGLTCQRAGLVGQGPVAHRAQKRTTAESNRMALEQGELPGGMGCIFRLVPETRAMLLLHSTFHPLKQQGTCKGPTHLHWFREGSRGIGECFENITALLPARGKPWCLEGFLSICLERRVGSGPAFVPSLSGEEASWRSLYGTVCRRFLSWGDQPNTGLGASKCSPPLTQPGDEKKVETQLLPFQNSLPGFDGFFLFKTHTFSCFFF